ncbi:MAG: transposase [Muribaculaceae bacterium]|nr:transposase [Muribaculaceae bacterium]
MSRDPKHDYKSRCIYHITINKAAGCPAFSHISGSSSQPVINRTQIGSIIESQILNFPNLYPGLQILQYVIMPDHIHFAIFVREYLPRSLGRYIGMMKVKCGQLIRTKYPGISAIFTEDFYDRYLRPAHKLTTIIEYIRQNPYRLMIRRENPDYFHRINNFNLNGTLWQAYGNILLLDNPFKASVIIHRADSDEIRAAKYNYWKHLAENGGVLISPFISAAEKAIRRLCEDVNGKLILLTNTPLEDRAKPTSHDFDLCATGRLLILAPMTPLPPERKTFMYLNSIAEAITSSGKVL